MEYKKSTRREFIQLASVAALSMSAGCISDKFVNKMAEEGKKPADYPVVVIGSGIGGLAGAVYLSRAGFPVTVIEQHDIPGGYATAFQRDNFNFDVSLHFFGVAEEFYKELGLEGKVERIPLRMTRRIVSKERSISIPEMKAEEFIEFVCRQYPEEKEGIRSFYGYCQAVYEELERFSQKMKSGYVFLPFMGFQYPKMWSLRNKTFADVLDKHVKSQTVKSALGGISSIYGLPPSRTSGFIAAMLTGSFMREKMYYFRTRSQDLSNGLVEVIKDNKGTVVLGQSATAILTENNTVTGVKTDDGTTYPAKIVVSNANAPDTFGKLLSGNEKAKKYREKLAEYEPSISSFLIWLGLKGPLDKKLFEHSITIESGFDVETDFKNYLACDAEKTPILMALYDNYFKGYSKPGTSTLTIMILSGYEPWKKFEKDYFDGNKDAYNREKDRIAKILIQRVEEKLIPGLSGKIQVMEASTPLTNMRFTRNPGGAIYGYPPTPENSFANRIKNSTPIKGLYLSSGWGSYWGSYPGGIMNGRDVYRLIMKEM